MTNPGNPDAAMFHGAPPAWALRREKPFWQKIWDLIGAPFRMALLPDHVCERYHLTSLRAERLGRVLGEIEGRCLDIGAGDNMLLNLYRQQAAQTEANSAAENSVGLDVFDWGGGCIIVPDCQTLPFEDQTFDTVTFIACLNHIPEREAALREALRVLRPGGKVVITMIGRFIGTVGHAIWWYSEDKHRDVDEEEEMGMDAKEVDRILVEAGFSNLRHERFVYGLNRMAVATKA